MEVAVTPSSQQIQAACLFLDVSQFTAISEHLSSGGMRGPELRIVGKVAFIF